MNMAGLNAETGTTPRQIRYLIVNGLMSPPTGGRAHAQYGEEHVQAVRWYTKLRSLGLGLDEIRKVRESLSAPPLAGDFPFPEAPPATLDVLARRSHSLAVLATTRLMQERPLVKWRYMDGGMDKCIDDVAWHIAHLRAAATFGCDILFSKYISWTRGVLVSHGVDSADLFYLLVALRDVLIEELDHAGREAVLPVLENALRAFPETDTETQPFVDPAAPQGALAQIYLDALLRGDSAEAVSLAQEIVGAGLRMADLHVQVIQPAMRQIGRLWQCRQIDVAHEHIATSITLAVIARLPGSLPTPRETTPVMVAACVAGEFHDIGLRMVADLHERAGWRLFFLGPNTPPTAIVSAVAEHQAAVLALSATMAPHLDQMDRTIAAIRADARTRGVRILVGGYPFNTAQYLWKRIGADRCATNAETALAESRAMLSDAEV